MKRRWLRGYGNKVSLERKSNGIATMTDHEWKLLKIVMTPILMGLILLPTYAEWCAAFDELFFEME